MITRNSANRAIRFLMENSAFLIIGAAVGLVWANIDPRSYAFIKETPAFHLNHVPVSLHFLINDLAMAFFFLLAGKEIREAMLPRGALSNVRTAALPLIATLGGMAGPAIIFFTGTLLFHAPELTRGWAVPMATDIAFSYLIARIIFPQIGGKTHPAIVFLLLLAIADDAGGLIVLATFYPQEVHNLLNIFVGVPPMLVFFTGAAAAILLALFFWKKLKITNFWPYLLLPGTIAWIAFHEGGIHPALALVPLVWCMPHEHSDMGIWAVGESEGKDTLNRIQQWWKSPVERLRQRRRGVLGPRAGNLVRLLRAARREACRDRPVHQDRPGFRARAAEGDAQPRSGRPRDCGRHRIYGGAVCVRGRVPLRGAAGQREDGGAVQLPLGAGYAGGRLGPGGAPEEGARALGRVNRAATAEGAPQAPHPPGRIELPAGYFR